jgi:hypothetical protein
VAGFYDLLDAVTVPSPNPGVKIASVVGAITLTVHSPARSP